LDKYEFLRDAYLQRRNSLIHDGNPPAINDVIDETVQESTDAEKKRSVVIEYIDPEPWQPIHDSK